MKLKDLLTSIATQSGVSADSPALKAIIDNVALNTVEVEEDLSKLLTAPRLTMEAAKANPDLKKHFKKEVFDGIREEVKRTGTELGLKDTDFADIDSQDTDFKRISALAKKVQTLEAAKAGAGTKDTEKLNKEIEKLNNQAAEIRTEMDGKLKAQNEAFETERIDWNLNSILSGYDYATGVDKDVNVTVGKTLVNKALTEKGLKIVKKDNALALQTSEGTEYFDDTNKKVPLNDFVNKTLANAKVLKASTGNNTGKNGQNSNNSQNQHQNRQNGNGGNGGGNDNGLNANSLLELSADN